MKTKCKHCGHEIEDYKKINYKDKEFRIYKWEDKPFNEFKIPKGFRLAEHSEFIELFDEKLIDYPKEGWKVYFVKHYSKRKQEKYVSRCYLNGDSDLSSNNSILSNSNDYGRVVVVK